MILMFLTFDYPKIKGNDQIKGALIIKQPPLQLCMTTASIECLLLQLVDL